MAVHVVEDLGGTSPFRARFSDPDALLNCDNPHCSVPWVTRNGLVAWMLNDHQPSCTLFADRIVVARSSDCLASALATHGRSSRRWSSPMAVGDWLDALRASLDIDPDTTPIGKLAGL